MIQSMENQLFSSLSQESVSASAATTPDRSGYDRRSAAYAGTLLRVGLGAMFVAHAWLKYAVFTLPGTAQFFAGLGLPAALGYAVFWAELLGGVLLIVGVWPRAVAAALVPVLLGATWAHAGNGWLFTAPGGGWEYPAILAMAAAVQALLGDGAWAAARTPAFDRRA